MRLTACIAFLSFLLMLQLCIAVTSPGFDSFGRSVTMNFAFHIGNSKIDDTITSTDSYISSHDAEVVAALASNTAFGTRSTELQDDYLLELRQPIDNRFFLTFTKGNNQTVDNTTTGTMIPKTFGDLVKPYTSSFPLYLRLEYNTVDIVNSIRWSQGPREIIIKNEGKNEKGQHKISIELIE